MKSNYDSAFAGKIAIGTGSTQVMGEATATHLAQRGAAGLVICGRNADRGRRLHGSSATPAASPTTSPPILEEADAFREVVDSAVRQFDRVEILVNCARWAHRSTLEEKTLELWDRLFAVNVRAPFLLMQGAAHLMRSTSTRGAIVNVISMASHGGTRDLTAYAAAKGALVTLTRTGEDEVGRRWYGGGDDWIEEASRRQPFGRLIEPDDVARAIGFLASDESGT